MFLLDTEKLEHTRKLYGYYVNADPIVKNETSFTCAFT